MVKPFHPSLMFAGKDKSLSQRHSTWLFSDITRKHQTRLERLPRDKHTSLLSQFVRYDLKILENRPSKCLYLVSLSILSLMFVDKAKSLPWRRSTWLFSDITRKHYTRMERLPRDKHSSLLSPFVSYNLKILKNRPSKCLSLASLAILIQSLQVSPRAYPRGAPERCFTWVLSDIPDKLVWKGFPRTSTRAY